MGWTTLRTVEQLYAEGPDIFKQAPLQKMNRQLSTHELRNPKPKYNYFEK
jgi:hypothetical protein